MQVGQESWHPERGWIGRLHVAEHRARPRFLGATLRYHRRCDLGAGAQNIDARFLGASDASPVLVSGERWHPETCSGVATGSGSRVTTTLVASADRHRPGGRIDELAHLHAESKGLAGDDSLIEAEQAVAPAGVGAER